MAKPKKPTLQLKAGTTNTLVATWEWKEKNTASYKVYWTYATGNKNKKDGTMIWFVGNESDVKVKNSEYSFPDNAISVKFKVKPIAKTHKVKKNKKTVDEPYWTSGWSPAVKKSVKGYNTPDPPSPPGAPSITLNAKHTAVTPSLTVDPKSISSVIFQNQDITSANKPISDQTVKKIPANGLVSVKFNLLDGKQYRIRAKVVDKQGRSSGWSVWTETFESAIDYPLWKGQHYLIHSAEAVMMKGDTIIDWKQGSHEVISYRDKQLKLSWVKPNAPKNLRDFSYEIEWTKDPKYFDMGSGTTVVTVQDYNRQYYIFTGDDFFGGTHPTTYFRIRSKNKDFVSKWNDLSYGVKVGLKPSPPTTWTSASSYSIGDKITFYWVHNSEDGAKESLAELTLILKRGTGIQQTDSYVGNGSRLDYPLTQDIFGNNPIVSINGVKKVKNTDYIYDEVGKKVAFNTAPENGSAITIQYYKTSVVTKNIIVQKSVADEDSISQYVYDTNNSDITGDTEIEWFVKTTGAGDESDASISRSVKVWSPPVIEAKTFNFDSDNNLWIWDRFDFTTDSIYTALRDIDGSEDTDVINGYPFFIYGLTGPITQKPIRYVLSIIANETYEVPSIFNDSVYVNEGEEVYSVIIDPKDSVYGENTFWYVLMAGSVMLMNNVEYTLKIYAMMDSGLSAEFSKVLTTEFSEDPFEVNADISIDDVNLSASILPRAYIDNNVDDPNDPLNENYDQSLVIPKEDVLLSVYRRNHDGTFTLISDNLDGSLYTTVFDLHPPLNFAVYRIVGIDKVTGKLVWSDIESEPINEPSIIIQWNEESSEFHSEANNYDDDEEIADILTPSSMLRLPWNIKINDSHAPDVSLVEYIGRDHPVSYYGTQRGETSTWSTDIDKEDEETLYNIRRLAIYPGDVYVREPSGTGYWANVTVSYDVSYDSLIIPITFNITRVEGGA